MGRDPTMEELVAEERHARNRLALYRAKSYSGKPTTDLRMRELQRLWEAAAKRVRDAPPVAAPRSPAR